MEKEKLMGLMRTMAIETDFPKMSMDSLTDSAMMTETQMDFQKGLMRMTETQTEIATMMVKDQ